MITLTSDFGLKDPYVAEMKGVILTINPKAAIIDITHDIEKFNIRMAAFILASATPYFPEGTVHLAIVDPGVGTQRRATIIKTKKSFFVGPDNGTLILAAQSQGIEQAYQLTNPKFMLPRISSTFHGRDIFAPAAAHLEKGVQPTEFGPEIEDLIKPKFSEVKHRSGSLIGEVLHIDAFGNLITNINEKEILQNHFKTVNVELSRISLKLTFAKAYAEAEPKEPIILIGSHGFLEIALNQGDAAEKFHVKPGDKIVVTAA
jgi:S-adenosyl-L-methionine hydrolase (adenosine-forming)